MARHEGEKMKNEEKKKTNDSKTNLTIGIYFGT